MTGRTLPGALLAAALALGPAAQAAEPLGICLEENVPPLSLKRGREATGFDAEVARRVAEQLGRPLRVQWYETKADADSYPDRQVNALLSDGRCDLVGGYPLSARGLGAPPAERAKLPDFAGARPEDRRRWVTLGTLAPSRAYRSAAFGVVLGPARAGLGFRHLDELKGLRLGVEERTLADAILTAYRGGVLLDQVTHVTAGQALFDRLAAGDYDAVLVEIQRWDAWAAGHPDSGLSLAGYRHPIGFNFGFVGLAAAAPLLAAVSDALATLREAGELPALAQRAGLTYAPPRVPEISPPVTIAGLRDD
ncbi:MAG: substrate-binding periplasmic protein [Paracraurococcus sp.]